jgi:HPt (histidine-containing phosphotransfer) domain-containing protein
MTEIRVNLVALQGFATQLEDRVAELNSAGSVPGVSSPLPVGGSPAWEGQALSDAYWTAAQDAQRLLEALREMLAYAAQASQATVVNYRGGDAQGQENNLRIAQAIDSGRQVPSDPDGASS